MYETLKYYIFLHFYTFYTLLISLEYFFKFSYILLKFVHIWENFLENNFNFSNVWKCVKLYKNVYNCINRSHKTFENQYTVLDSFLQFCTISYGFLHILTFFSFVYIIWHNYSVESIWNRTARVCLPHRSFWNQSIPVLLEKWFDTYCFIFRLH